MLERHVLEEIQRLARDLDRHDQRMTIAAEAARERDDELKTGLERAVVAFEQSTRVFRESQRIQNRILLWSAITLIVIALGRTGVELLRAGLLK